MDEAGVFIGQSAIIWFLVVMARAWLPAVVRNWIDGPARVWGLVLIAAGAIVLLEAGSWDVVRADLATAILDAIMLAITAIGIDNVQVKLGQVSAELNLNIGAQSRSDE